jgi:hypothetical protein
MDTYPSPAGAVPPSLQGGALGSLWGGLSAYLIASFYEVAKRQGSGGAYAWQPVAGGHTVRAPLLDPNLDVVLNWQSPFEQSGPESKAPTLMAMLQSGALLPFVDTFFASAGSPADNGLAGAQAKTKGFLSRFEGRTGITKLNSTQVFTGMPPVKIQLTALFRAWADSAGEVMAPFNQLMAWALPQALSADGSLLDRLVDLKNQPGRDAQTYVDALLPSQSPTHIALGYKGRTYAPLVIESISEPMNAPIDRGGNYVEMAVQMTLGTLTAWDRQDWQATASGAAPAA